MAKNDEQQFGFTCPEELLPFWNQSECTIENCTDGTAIVLDHSIQREVYHGHNREECANWLYGGDPRYQQMREELHLSREE